MPSAIDTVDLPSGSSPTLQLVKANEAEMIDLSIKNAASWRGPLDVNAYLEREAHLRDTHLNRNGGITYWILVNSADAPPVKAVRRILASCETLKKRALVARSDGDVKEITSHGIGSVYCSPDFRGRGYAQRMLAELAKILDTWQQKEGGNSEFTVLWSDIGKASLLAAEDIEELCRLDEASLRSAMAEPTSPDVGILVALIPDAATMQWHHAREEFLGERLRDRFPFAKGALAKTATGKRAWCIWTRTFGANRDDDMLNILRLVTEGVAVGRQANNVVSDGDLNDSEQAIVAAVAAILEQAQLEATFWGMTSVQLWNPSPLTFLAAKKVEASAKIVDRDDESIPSLRWHGKAPPDGTKIDWIANEKYGWC
ncbi:MAG: hypothetical protein Q9225_006085 [Loekoesia sp. 1 TL-2023]